MKKIENENLEKEIINLYNQSLSIRKISKLINKSTSFVSRILQDQRLYKYEKGESVAVKRSFELTDGSLQWVAQCKVTKEIFNDYKNQCGILTRHILKNNPEFKEPTGFKKRQQEKKTGKFWFEDFFDIITIQKVIIDKKQCPYCEWSTIDLNNKSGAFTSHLYDNHNISVIEHIKNYPDDSKLFKTKLNTISKQELLKSSEDNFVVCKICNKKLSYITNSHLKKHNISSEDYKLKFSIKNFSSQSFIKKTSKNLLEANKTAIKKYVSKAESSIVDFLNTNNIETISPNRKLLDGIEIDIVCEKYKIGIEYNGCRYHSEKFGKKSKNFHLNKTKIMNNYGYKLIHIFEDEWELKNKIVISKLQNIFHLNKNEKIYARNCITKKIDNKTKNIFLNQYHIQGSDKSNISLGCFYNDILISVMTFDNIRQMNKGSKEEGVFELKRFCTHLDFRCIGVAGKMLSFFIKNYNPKKILSFADMRWTLDSENNLYTKIGFKLTKILSPDYSYYNNKINRLKRFHKFQFGKKSLKKLFPNLFDENKTEWEIMQEAGYDRIWDCGKFRYELDCTNQRSS